ncbi:osmotic avoidance abnormal protein 3-like [Copidosoma floridanum]|uniref:osmotic avoidance abnormal protein 3-like n=1 Tax=Copidosoma floridanum TaxID=29053 RepID=UPI0006C97459|nr:osmotic avoidance abnormal protein 3-like [Copidosoma floridanum]
MSESVKVAVRCRPMNQKELQHKCKSVVAVDSSQRSCSLSDNGSCCGKVYQFDATFEPEASTEAVYEQVGSYVVEAVLEGYNGTVFAYGQTGCGKSHTMRGFIERALEHLFEATSTASSDTRYLALLTYLEIYNEKLRDLLDPGEGGHQLQLKEDPVRGTYVAGGLREVTVKDGRECARLVEQGDRRRVAAATRMNAASSRSHAVLTISLEAIAIGPAATAGSGAVRRGRLHLVDLAGSERQRRTGATGDRLKEAASINLSLSALGNVISALAAGNGRHVPYRDSKLTRLLRDSLGGNARTLMIACVSPSDVDAEETLSTLRYAARARCIKNKPIVNEDPKDALLRQYQIELQRLRKLLETNATENDELQSTKNVDEDDQRADPEDKTISADGETLAEAVEVPSSESPASNGVVDERHQRKREAAKQEVLRRLERLTIGGEALGDAEIQRRRERRRKRLQALAEALERSSQEGNGGAFEVYGQLKSTEDALKRMARKAKQLEAEAADLQASWDEERRELLRRELLTQQICEAMLPHLRPGCPLRNLQDVRDASTWSSELGRWRLPDLTGKYQSFSLPPPAPMQNSPPPASDRINNNSSTAGARGIGSGYGRSSSRSSLDENDSDNEAKRVNIADVYFKRNRVDKILAHAREAKTFDAGGRVSKSGSSSEEAQPSPQPIASTQQRQLGSLGALNAGPSIDNWRPKIGGWLDPEQTAEAEKTTIGSPPYGTALTSLHHKRNHLQPPPRVLEALPAYPHISTSALPHRLQGPIS